MKTMYKNKLSILFTMVCAGTILLSSCKKDSTPIVYADAKVRIVNANATSSTQDFYQNDVKISTTALAYGSASTGYYTVKGGPSSFAFRDSGTATLTASRNVSVGENGSYTIFYYKDASGNGDLTGFLDDNTAPATGKARVRFLNFGFSFNNAINVSYASTGTLIVNGLGLDISSYYSIDPNTDLGVAVIGSPATVIQGSNFVAGKIYTVWFDATSATTANYHVVVQN
jgi:hypothetical protein